MSKTNPLKAPRRGGKAAAPGVQTGHRAVVETALEAVDDVFSDTRVPPETTIESLREIRDAVDMKISAVAADIRRAGRGK